MEMMPFYALVRIATNASGRITRARLREADPQRNVWLGNGHPLEMSAAEVAALIDSGATVQSFFNANFDYPGDRHGANFRAVQLADGARGIELEFESDGRTLADIVRI